MFLIMQKNMMSRYVQIFDEHKDENILCEIC